MASQGKVSRALISVTDKTGVVEFARALKEEFGVEIISTGGTAKALVDGGVPVTPIEEYTGFPEMMDGRVKTLHPKVHGGLLARRDSEQHMAEAAEHGIGMIDMVVVNLYEFEKTVANPDVTFADAIEHIDIGGPSMLRSAAKNADAVTVVSDPADYETVLAEMRDLMFAWKVCKTVKSNAILIAKNEMGIGMGPGQPNRVDSALLACQRADEVCERLGQEAGGYACASDAFFPFRDNVDTLAAHGVTAIIQPGGSVRDEESIDACNEHGIAMVFTGTRHFRH